MPMLYFRWPFYFRLDLKPFFMKISFFLQLEIVNLCCPVKMFRFLPTVEMTRFSEGLLRVGVGSGKTATNTHPKKLN
jgi:hypothetical protein